MRRWSQEEQVFEPLGEGESMAYAEGVRNMDFDKYLGAYPMANYEQWVGLSNYLAQTVIDRLDPLNHYVLSEGKERQMRDQEDKAQAPLEGGDEVDSTLEALQKQVEEEEVK